MDSSQQQSDQPAIRGVLNINKPRGLTSMMVCRVVKGKLRSGGAPKKVKVGHGGTLDPLASGVLVVLIGKATKQQDRIMGTEKGYRAVVDLAHTSESCDMEFEPVPAEIEREPTLEEVRVACDKFVGDIDQVPPIYSAVWVDGKRAYHLARQGEEVELKSRVIRDRSHRDRGVSMADADDRYPVWQGDLHPLAGAGYWFGTGCRRDARIARAHIGGWVHAGGCGDAGGTGGPA